MSRALPVVVLLAACAPEGGAKGEVREHALVELRGTVPGAEGQVIAAVARTDGALWMQTIASDGSFALEAGEGELALALLDEDQSPVALYQGEAGTWIEATGDTELGALAWSDETHVLRSGASARRGAPDLSDFVGIDTSKDDPDAPGPAAGISGDIDEDGIPDLFDNDRNNNGRYDAVEIQSDCALQWEVKGDGTVPGEALTAAGDIDCVVFDNLKLVGTELLRGDGDALPRTDDHTLTLQLTVPDPLAGYVDSVEAVGIPAYANGDVAMDAAGWSFRGYPSPGSSWAATGHALVDATDHMGQDHWTIWIHPTTDPAAAVYQFRVNLSDGGSILATTRLAFVFHTGALVTTYTDGAGDVGMSYPMTEGDDGTASGPLPLDSSGIYTFAARRPIDGVGGSPICGMTVQTEIFYEDSTGAQLDPMAHQSAATVDTAPCSPGEELSATLTTADLPKTVNGADVAAYRVGFMVSGAQGDNTATNVWADWAE